MHRNIHDVGLLDTDFQSAILNMLKELKKNMPRELKKSLRMISHQIENISIEIKKIYEKGTKKEFWN